MSGYSKAEEDYLEAIYVTGLTNKVIRVKDVAEALEVKMPSVVSAVRSLSEKGLVEQEKYGHIELTAKGVKAAKDVYERHQLVYAFLHEMLNLDPHVAEKDACEIEHHLSPQTRQRLSSIVEFIRGCGGGEALFFKRFMHYVNTGERPVSCRGCQKS